MTSHRNVLVHPNQDIAVEWVPPDQLKLPNRHPRIHSEGQLSKIVASIICFGVVVPLIVTEDGEIVCGAGRLEAARLIGLETVPVIRITHLNRAQIKAYRVADSKLTELGEWDEDAVREILLELDDAEVDLDAVGFEIAEAEALFVYPGTPGEDEPLEETPEPTVIPGDSFNADGHTVLCADAGDPQTLEALVEEGEAAVVITDPPYNVPVAGHVTGKGRHKHDEFAMASGEMSDEAFLAFLIVMLRNAAACVAKGSLLYFFMDWRGIGILLNAAKEVGLDYINLAVFVKTNAGMGSLYRSQHELVAIFRKPGAKHRNNIQLGKYGRNRTNVWEYRGANSFGATRDRDLAMHPTVKPVEMIADAIKDCTKRGDVVIDLFGGSGTTLIAAQKTGRIARLVEISPGFVETTLRRYEAEFGVKAIHVETGMTLDELAEHRAAPGDEPVVREPIVRRRPRRRA